MSWFDIGAQYLQQTLQETIQEAEKFVFEEVPAEAPTGGVTVKTPQAPVPESVDTNKNHDVANLTTATKTDNTDTTPTIISTTNPTTTTSSQPETTQEPEDSGVTPTHDSAAEDPRIINEEEELTSENAEQVSEAPDALPTEGEVQSLRKAKAAAEIQLAKIKEILAAREKQLETLASQNAHLQSQNSLLNKAVGQISKIEENMVQITSERDKYKSMVQNDESPKLRELIKEKDMAIALSKKESEKLRQEGTEMATKLVAAQQDAMKLRKEVKSMTTQIDNGEEERKRLKEKIKKRDERVRELVQQCDSYAKTFSTSQDTNVGVQKQLETTKKEFAALSQQLNET
eukprot:TRINITY_DN7281_c0_g1_i5.p1 TRINITY_DN7281_c0_g1~~TRINITY_DN7281_c0_g1_i5.p1  ORF type:complete len:345 (-),score=95.58 TRINITY_DN7281_c0_g1_i5:1378-2412(-)